MSQGLIVTDTQGPRGLRQPRLCRHDRRRQSPPTSRRSKGCFRMCPKPRRSIYRLASGLRDGQAGDGEFRLAQSIRPGAEPGARWYRVRARTFNVPSQRQPLARLADRRHFARAGRAGTLLSRPADRRSTISTTRRPASSPPTRKAVSPISTPRSPSGWASILRASRPATPPLRKSSPATAWR